MLGMLRRSRISLLIFAALLLAEPLLHSHPLQLGGRASDAPCVVCAAGAVRLPAVTVSVAAPQIIAYTVTPAAVIFVTVTLVSSLASRAPPSL